MLRGIALCQRAAVDLEHGFVDFDYVPSEAVVILSKHAPNLERDLHDCRTA
jgi:hypothetical protein